MVHGLSIQAKSNRTSVHRYNGHSIKYTWHCNCGFRKPIRTWNKERKIVFGVIKSWGYKDPAATTSEANPVARARSMELEKSRASNYPVARNASRILLYSGLVYPGACMCSTFDIGLGDSAANDIFKGLLWQDTRNASSHYLYLYLYYASSLTIEKCKQKSFKIGKN